MVQTDRESNNATLGNLKEIDVLSMDGNIIQGFEEVQKTLNWSERSDSLKVTPKVSMTYTQNSGDVPEQRMTAGFF